MIGENSIALKTNTRELNNLKKSVNVRFDQLGRTGAIPMQFKYRIGMRAIALAFAIGAATAGAQSALEIRQDRLQLQSDRAALQRQIARLAADEARLKADTASGKMSAQSKDAYAVYQAELVNIEERILDALDGE